MPVNFNEPLSFLQRLAEYMEYSHLLDKASQAVDAVRRMEVPPFYRVLLGFLFLFTTCSRVGLGSTGFDLVFTEVYLVVPSFTGFSPDVLGFDQV